MKTPLLRKRSFWAAIIGFISAIITEILPQYIPAETSQLIRQIFTLALPLIMLFVAQETVNDLNVEATAISRGTNRKIIVEDFAASWATILAFALSTLAVLAIVASAVAPALVPFIMTVWGVGVIALGIILIRGIRTSIQRVVERQ